MLRCHYFSTVLKMVELFSSKGKMIHYREANANDGFEGWVVFVA